jgi:hypothetical protein
MSKPIFIIRFPYNKDERDRYEFIYNNVNNSLKNEYNVLALIDNSTTKVEFECCNSTYNEQDFDELKEKVLNIILNDRK